MFGASLFVDGIDGVDDIDDILDGNGLVRTEHDTGVVDAWFYTRGNQRLKPFDIGGSVANLLLVVLVSVNRHILLGHGLAATLGEQ